MGGLVHQRLDSRRRVESFDRRPEGRQGTVAGVLEDPSVVSVDFFADQLVVKLERVAHRLWMRLPQPGRTLDVSKEKSDGRHRLKASGRGPDPPPSPLLLLALLPRRGEYRPEGGEGGFLTRGVWPGSPSGSLRSPPPPAGEESRVSPPEGGSTARRAGRGDLSPRVALGLALLREVPQTTSACWRSSRRRILPS